MIDTVKFLIPIKDQKTLETLKAKLTRTSRENLITKELKFEYFMGEIDAGSYVRTISFKIDELGIFFEFSIPKYEYGNNVEMLHPIAIPEILNDFYNELCKSLQENLPAVSEWVVYRLDLCYNWTFESKEKCQSLMNFIQRIDLPRKKTYRYDTSIMYKGTAYTIKFYLKGPEFLKHDFKDLIQINENKTHELMNWAYKILRFEVEFRKGYLTTLFGKNEVTVLDIADEWHIEEIQKYYLAHVFKYINKENMKYEDVRQLINANFTPVKALRLYQFYKGYFYEKDEKYHIEKGLNRSTIYRYKKDLKSVGVSFTENLDDKTFIAIDELVIPSKNAYLSLLDYKPIHTIVSI